jgi:hypothetical protein
MARAFAPSPAGTHAASKNVVDEIIQDWKMKRTLQLQHSPPVTPTSAASSPTWLKPACPPYGIGGDGWGGYCRAGTRGLEETNFLSGPIEINVVIL